MFERPQSGELAVLVNITFPQTHTENTLQEFRELAFAAGAKPVATITGTRLVPESKYFVGTGKANEIQAAITATNANLILFNHNLSPAQERNLEQLLKCRVLDRTGLILDIFAQRARTFEGKLQVELAQLQHLSTRLVRGWTHLERQRGGIGLRGPGETQLETDRRLVRNRIKTISKRLEKVRLQRAQGQRARRKSELPTVSLVGYTNAGKSTLFNYLTGAAVYVADQPFATLDPTLRRCNLPNSNLFILADTVGFIRELPHNLVDAFSATLEETRDADLLLHVVDAHSSSKNECIEEVNAVLAQIDAQQVPQLLIYNKIDLLNGYSPRLDRRPDGLPWRVWISATTGAGIDLVQQALQELLEKDIIECEVTLLHNEGSLRAALYELGAIHAEQIDSQGNWQITIRLPQSEFNRLFFDRTRTTPC